MKILPDSSLFTADGIEDGRRHMKNWKDIFIGKMLDFVFGMFGVILCFLFLLSITETSKLNIEEVVSYHKDTPFFHILLFITIFLFAANSKRQVM